MDLWVVIVATAGFIFLLWLLVRKQELRFGLGLLWLVKIEPAPCDILFIASWLKRLLQGRLCWPAHSTLHLLLAFIFLNFLQIIWADSLVQALWFAGATAYVISLCFYFSSSRAIPNVQAWKSVKTYYLAAVVIAALTLVWLAGIYILGWMGPLGSFYFAGRPKGFFKDPNVAGPFVVTGVLYALSRFVFLKTGLLSRAGLLLLLTLVGTLVSFSRGALINLLAGILAIGVVSLLARRGLRFGFAVSAIILLMLLTLPYLLGPSGQAFRFIGLVSYDKYGRFIAWKSALMIARDYFYGIGPGQFEIYSPEYQLAMPGTVYITPSAHNLYLRVLAENGVLGFVTLGIALTVLLLSLGKAICSALLSHNRELLADGAWLFSALWGIMIESFVIDTLHWRHFWIIAGCAISYPRLLRQQSD